MRELTSTLWFGFGIVIVTLIVLVQATIGALIGLSTGTDAIEWMAFFAVIAMVTGPFGGVWITNKLKRYFVNARA